MPYRSYICDDCGFSSEEEPGVYICPKCNNKMRIAQAKGTFGGGDNTRTDGKFLLYILFFIFVGAICVGLLNIFGVILFIILFYFFRKALNNSMRNKAIKVDTNKNNVIKTNTQITYNDSNKVLYCGNCGQKLQENQKFCSNCGNPIEK